MITYNHECFIHQAIEGVLMQERNFDFELIIANDNSTDNSNNVISDIIDNHPKGNTIKYINRNENIGMQLNFLDAYYNCSGEYIALCEGDDYWTDPLKLQKQVDFLKANPEYVVCYHDANIIDEKGNQLSNSLLGKWKKDYSENDLKKEAWLPTLTRCFRNENIIIPKEFYKVTAGDLFLTGILGLYGKAKYLEFNGANYREHSNSIWNSKNTFDRNLALLNDYLQLNNYWKNKKEIEVSNYYKLRLKKTNEYLFEICIKNNEIKYFIKVLKINLLHNKSFYNLYNIYLFFKLVKNKILNKIN